MDARFLFIRLAEGAAADRHWNATDETGGPTKEGGRTWHEFIPRKESPMDVALTWRTEKNAPPSSIGVYRLDLEELLKAGYIRADKSDGRDGFRIMFVYARNGCIYLQRDPDSPRLVVGALES
jgi:hypothetical protein